jgi:PAS domain S-box-containing protein
MTRKLTRAEDAAELRQQAEEMARREAASPLVALAPEDLRRALHELRVHQIELEMQNDELRRTQVELEASRSRYFDLYDLAPVGYVTLREDGLIQEANLTAAVLLGVDRSRLLSGPLSRFILKEDQNLYYLQRKQVSDTGRPQARELRMLKSDGTALWVQLAMTTTPDVEGEPVSYVTLSDITERKRAEEARAALELQFRQVQKMESVGRLAGGVAHEFNNKLMGVMNYVELCRDGLPPEHPVRGYLDEITTEARHSADIAGQLLTFARKQVVAPRVMDLSEALAGMTRMLQALLGEDIALTWMQGANLWPLKGDPGQLNQILVNLCLNARDAIAGVGRVTIETANVTLDDAYCAENPGTTPGEYVRLVVSDNGCGMSKDVLAHIFEPFYTTKEVGKGTGLGLATVYGIVEQSLGHIAVQSEVGKGTTFRIYLPRAARAFETAAETVAPVGLPRGTETILLAEDEKSIRVTSCWFLELLGYAVMAAGTPEEAQRLAGTHSGPIHLLVTDVIMPGMNGPDLAKLLAERFPNLKCLFMSGYPADVMLHRGALNEGMSFLSKPFSREDLARKVREVLDGSRKGSWRIVSSGPSRRDDSPTPQG